ncbi:hypothetical protein Poli38472_000059 [Pythium oligandrum]|uniref:Uncharacterized protein n=1 Tax=Pythium oligandrum TaxID=41045 RepID=A0A8K1FHR2_PYTOL|nr:hypothetical protein Poli38472_000059 [Pythium oligandrum]|eukprot:TMW60017.1 hypothetical protein Poli38472_000059 [Pythium oligandrum]
MFVSALDRLDDGVVMTDAKLTQRIADSVRFLKHVESVEITGNARNWDAKRCYVLNVNVKDSEIKQDDPTQARLQVLTLSAPFQIERTPKELRELEKTLKKWSEKPHQSPESCAYCARFADSETKRGGFLSFLSKSRTEEEWEEWLKQTISKARDTDCGVVSACQGVQHIPSVLARFLLQEFASDVIF